MAIHTENDLRRAMQRRGHHFLDADTMRFFKSRIGWIIPIGEDEAVFTESQRGPHGPREHSVRYWDGEDTQTVVKGLGSSREATRRARTFITNLKALIRADERKSRRRKK